MRKRQNKTVAISLFDCRFSSLFFSFSFNKRVFWSFSFRVGGPMLRWILIKSSFSVGRQKKTAENSGRPSLNWANWSLDVDSIDFATFRKCFQRIIFCRIEIDTAFNASHDQTALPRWLARMPFGVGNVCHERPREWCGAFEWSMASSFEKWSFLHVPIPLCNDTQTRQPLNRHYHVVYNLPAIFVMRFIQSKILLKTEILRQFHG